MTPDVVSIDGVASVNKACYKCQKKLRKCCINHFISNKTEHWWVQHTCTYVQRNVLKKNGLHF